MSDATGLFYIVWPRRHQLLKEDVYKIGKTSQPIAKRLQGYDKHTKVILCCYVNDRHDIENKVKQKFKEDFVCEIAEYGADCEYFRGDRFLMIQTAMRVILDHNNEVENTPKTLLVKKTKLDEETSCNSYRKHVRGVRGLLLEATISSDILKSPKHHAILNAAIVSCSYNRNSTTRNT